ncbi:outer membrane lipoprotein-sorting protein [Thiomicrospira pelophila]|uniref:outer membrane lipoprotein-sorting protein n=1 Tax=Thiomicrospira pelophila TaxID=934 RepID=UPI0004A72AFB|nr:outer membrane lipoprotein-sorting protein [Thiomicrospira pelophila]
MRIVLFSFILSLLPGLVLGQSKTAAEIIEASLDLWRGDTSYSVTEMIIHRPEWQREMRLEGWTRGMKDSLIRFVYPPRDADNATLKLDNEMWIFTPKLNRVTKLPASMMTQSWMGSDFSYNDLARSDQTLDNYTHTLLETRQQDGFEVYIIEAIPKANAPVVWGKEVAKIRGDYVMLENVFYDQSMQEVKRLQTLKIEDIDGRPFPTVMRITNADKPDQWTEIRTSQVMINIDLPDYLFTLANLQRPRPWKP